MINNGFHNNHNNGMTFSSLSIVAVAIATLLIVICLLWHITVDLTEVCSTLLHC